MVSGHEVFAGSGFDDVPSVLVGRERDRATPDEAGPGSWRANIAAADVTGVDFTGDEAAVEQMLSPG